jgi:hypothetical protein
VVMAGMEAQEGTTVVEGTEEDVVDEVRAGAVVVVEAHEFWSLALWRTSRADLMEAPTETAKLSLTASESLRGE